MAQFVYNSSTWYEATINRTPLDSFVPDAVYDACVVGGGLAGLTTALELARKGRSVILLEAQRIGSGASGRNGGFVSNGFALGYGDLKRRVGAERARELFQLSRRGTEYVRQQISAHAPHLYMGAGMLLATRHNDQGALQSYATSLQTEIDEPVEFISQQSLQLLLKTERYFSAISFERAFHIHPLGYCLLLASLARQAGARVVEECRAVSVAATKTGFSIATDQGAITAGCVVHCTSALDRTLHRPSGRAVLPVATYIAVTEPLEQQVIQTRAAVADTRRAGDYYRLIAERRLLWGGKITTRVMPPAHLAEVMKRDMVSVYPELSGVRMDYAWDGLMAYAIHKMPLIGQAQDGQWYATAFGGHGLNTTAMAGLLIAEAITNGEDSFRQFAPFAPGFGIGPFGRLGVQGSYWWMQARDKWDESRPRKP